jgi:hypothetical protein
MWLYRLRKLNGPNFTWPLMMFAGVAPESVLERVGKIHVGKPLLTKSRRELIATLRPNYLKYLRSDNGDLPEEFSGEGLLDQSQMDLVPGGRSLKVPT